MIFLEDYIKDGGKITISPQQENQLLLNVRFRGIDHEVSSQKGIRYLLAHIEQKIAGNEELLKTVEEKFPYGLSWQSLTPLDHLLNKVTVHIYSYEGEIFMDLFQIHALDKYAKPGIQHCQLKSSSKRVLEILEQEPKFFETIEFPKQKKKLDVLY